MVQLTRTMIRPAQMLLNVSDDEAIMENAMCSKVSYRLCIPHHAFQIAHLEHGLIAQIKMEDLKFGCNNLLQLRAFRQVFSK